MEYTDAEDAMLATMNKTDFKHISKQNLFDLTLFRKKSPASIGGAMNCV